MSDCMHRIRELSATARFVECSGCGNRFDLQALFSELRDADDALAEAEAEVERLYEERKEIADLAWRLLI